MLTQSPWLPSALRGFFRAGSTVHLIEPLEGGGEEGQHALYRAEHLLKAGTCGVSDSSLEKALGPRVSAAFRPRNRPVARDTQYVELYVVVDSTEVGGGKWGAGGGAGRERGGMAYGTPAPEGPPPCSSRSWGAGPLCAAGCWRS